MSNKSRKGDEKLSHAKIAGYDFKHCLDDQMSHLWELYGCRMAGCDHVNHYEGILCGLDKTISEYDGNLTMTEDLIFMLSDKIKRL